MIKKRWMKVVSLMLILGAIGGLMTLKADQKKDYLRMSKSEILSIPMSELADLPFEELIAISDKFNFSEEE
jgi:cytochrome c-type biogenesis protein CcmE